LRWCVGRLVVGAVSPAEIADTFYPTDHGIGVDRRVFGVVRASVTDPGS
jgi:hypothetical protein